MSGDVLIRQLEYLAALARERHFGRAAATCHASQPALSAGIRKLESELGVTIVLRGRRFTGFTPEGQRVVGWAHRILAERDALRTDLSRMRGGLTATLRIGAIPTAVPASSLLTGPFIDRHPHAGLRLRETSSREIIRGLVEFDLDVGLTYLDPEPPPGLRGRALYTERYLFLTSATEPLAERADITWAEAAVGPLCMLDRSMQNRRILDRAVAAAGAELRPAIEVDTVGGLYAQMTGARWSSIIPHTWLYAFGLPAGMRAVPLRPQPEHTAGRGTGALGQARRADRCRRAPRLDPGPRRGRRARTRGDLGDGGAGGLTRPRSGTRGRPDGRRPDHRGGRDPGRVGIVRAGNWPRDKERSDEGHLDHGYQPLPLDHVVDDLPGPVRTDRGDPKPTRVGSHERCTDRPG